MNTKAKLREIAQTFIAGTHKDRPDAFKKPSTRSRTITGGEPGVGKGLRHYTFTRDGELIPVDEHGHFIDMSDAA